MLGDSLEVLKTLPDDSVDSCVCDPPYGLAFMGKKWDYDVPSVELWAQVLRVLKPGGHLLSFGGTRTYHRMVVAIEDAGFEIRDQIMWIYGCLSEDSEILTDKGWLKYTDIVDCNAVCYNLEDGTFKVGPVEEVFVYDYEDTAYRIESDLTDQIVSRNHRCIVERGGREVFEVAEALQRQENVPVLEDLPGLLRSLRLSDEGAGASQQDLLAEVHESKAVEGPDGRLSDAGLQVFGVRQAIPAEMAKSAQDVFLQVPRQEKGERPEDVCGSQGGCEQGPRGMDKGQHEVLSLEDDGCRQSGVAGRRDVQAHEGQLHRSEVRTMSEGVQDDGAEGRLRDGASAHCGASDRAPVEALGGGSPRQSQDQRQSLEQPHALCDEYGSQVVRASRFAKADMATVTPIPYKGKVWCVKVSTGAFVARRNGKVFITGNSGFPKSLDVSKAIDKAAGVEREVIGPDPNQSGRMNNTGIVAGQTRYVDAPPRVVNITAPATEAAKEWSGWGTALKPANEPIVLARKPLSEKTIAKNVLKFGTGALNIDATRIATTDNLNGGTYSKNSEWIENPNDIFGARRKVHSDFVQPQGRWPANLILDDTAAALLDEQSGVCKSGGASSGRGFQNVYVGGKVENELEESYPKDKGSGASRFFYVAKPSRRERNAGLEGMPERESTRHIDQLASVDGRQPMIQANVHPTVKPVRLMEYLIKLVTPPGGTVLEPFLGSGTTLVAAATLGFNGIGIERESEYLEIARRRIAHFEQETESPREDDDQLELDTGA